MNKLEIAKDLEEYNNRVLQFDKAVNDAIELAKQLRLQSVVITGVLHAHSTIVMDELINYLKEQKAKEDKESQELKEQSESNHGNTN